jgi:hypothetical protein
LIDRLIMIIVITIAFVATGCRSNNDTVDLNKNAAWVEEQKKHGEELAKKMINDPEFRKHVHQATYPDYPLDLDGQLARIEADGGQTDEAVLRNFLEYDDSITFDRIKKNPIPYFGKACLMHGKIIQISENENQTWAQVALNSSYSYIIYIKANFTTNFVEDDMVYILGYLADPEPNSSKGGWVSTLPALAARKIMNYKERRQLDAEALKRLAAQGKK